MIKDNKIILTNVRLSFPHLFKPQAFKGAAPETAKYRATLLFSKEHVKLKNEIDKFIQDILSEAKLKVPSDKIFISDGDEKDAESYPGYKDHWVVRCSNPKSQPPRTLNKYKEKVTEEDNLFYSGCYVDAVINPWLQKNTFGKAVNCNILGIRFRDHGEPLSGGGGDVTGMFEDLNEDEEIDL